MKNLESILSVIIEYELRKDNIYVKLNQYEIDYVYNLIKLQSQIFNSISNEIQNICYDGKIDIDDIPQIILLISKIYKSNIIMNNIENIDIVSIVKFTFNSILHAGILPLGNIDINVIDKIVNSSIDLLKLNIDIKKNDEICYNLLCNIQ
jgi:hypothetical protein